MSDFRSDKTRSKFTMHDPGSTSTTLIDLIKLNDPLGWETFHYIYRPSIIHWCERCQLLAEDAEDVVQETWISARRSLANFRRVRPEDTFRGWLWTITRRKIADLMRKSDGVNLPIIQNGSPLLEQLPEQPPDDPGEGVKSMLRGMDIVNQQCRSNTSEYVRLRYRDHWTHKEIAAHFDVTEDAVKKGIARYKLRLRQVLGEAPTR